MNNSEEFRHFTHDDSVLEAPDFMKVKLLLTMLHKQNVYIQNLETNISILIKKGKECASQLTHSKIAVEKEKKKNKELAKQIESITKEKKKCEARIASLEKEIQTNSP
ncbi:hypothetical protein FACS189464_3500 [Bacteroidia bacterium]|nr:hypothetical protein FACS189464_3500 [Bacteroidia bacterium]